MAFKMRELMIIDVEATCWQKPKHKPEGEHQEIIEVGYTLIRLHPEVERLAGGGLLVKPTTSQVSAFCEELTGIRPKDVENARSFAEICTVMEDDLGTRLLPWASWGDFDRTLFTRQCERENVPYPLGRTHFNLKAMHAIATKSPKQYGLTRALELHRMKFQGRHHSGADDAENIARIAMELIRGFHKVMAEPDTA